MKKTLLLIDGSNFIFRAYHALPPLSTSTGTPTNAIRGFLSMLRVLMKDVPTDYVACVVDPKGKTFRSEIYPDYKANRPPMPEDLSFRSLELKRMTPSEPSRKKPLKRALMSLSPPATKTLLSSSMTTFSL